MKKLIFSFAINLALINLIYSNENLLETIADDILNSFNNHETTQSQSHTQNPNHENSQSQSPLQNLNIENINKLDTNDFIDIIKKQVPNVEDLIKIIKQISAEDLNQKLISAEAIKVINVLGPRFYQDCHIKNSVNYPLRKFIKLAAKNLSKTDEIVTYCALDECNASEKAAILLVCLGYTNVSEYIGGIKEWFQKSKENSGQYLVDGPCKCSYLLDNSETCTDSCNK